MSQWNVFLWDNCNITNWAEDNLHPKHCHLCGKIGEDIEIESFFTVKQDWDFLIVLESGCRDIVDNILNLLNITNDKVIFPLDEQDLLEKKDIMLYLLKDTSPIKRELLYTQEQHMRTYTSCTVEGVSYIGNATDDIIMKRMFTTGYNWSRSEMIIFHELAQRFYPNIPKNGFFCDIGANIGTSCIYFKKKIDSQAKILAFEPVKSNYNVLRANVILNDIDDSEYIIEHMGISDKQDVINISYNETNPGASTFLDSQNASESVPVDSLDHYLSKKGIAGSDIKYLWIDTEGFEAFVLNGARELLGNNSIPMILEFTPSFLNKSNSFDLFVSVLKEFYTTYVILEEVASNQGITHEIDSLNQYRDQEIQIDLFFLK